VTQKTLGIAVGFSRLKLFAWGFNPRHLLLAFLLAALIVQAAAPLALAHEPEADEPAHGHEADTDEPTDPMAAILTSAQFDQNLGDQVPLDITFTDETGRSVQLADIINDKPTVLSMNYYECDSLCPLIMDNAAGALKLVPFTMGEDYNMITVSFDPDETPDLAATVKEHMVERYERDGAAQSWSVLTGDKANIDRLAEAVGFNYAWDESWQQYAHPSGLIMLGPGGKIARYIYGFEFNPRDLRLALVEASENRIASPVDHVLLFCYRYNPSIGKYSAVAFNMMRGAGLVTVFGLVLLVGVLLRRERQLPAPTAGTAG
jgi:protein SCO1